ncbi:MAG: cysteine peptidase family C39 domain-containing protein [bacterium]|nr:cysteine peptidase family C39 domain-containing protein [bacterium]
MRTSPGLRRRRTPVIPQMHATECGAACLGILLAHHGRHVSTEELRVACRVTRDGASASDIVAAGRAYGLTLTGWRMEADALSDLEGPAILFWEFNHFVVLEGIRGGRYYLNDPANGRRSVSAQTIDRAFTGVVLRAERSDSFVSTGRPPGIFRKLWPWLAPAKSALEFSVVAGLLAAVPVAALPVLLGLFVDRVLGGSEPGWGAPLAWALAISGAVMYLLVWLQQYMFRKMAVRLAVSGAQGFLGRMFRLPPQFFEHRFAGDLTSRVHLVDAVAVGASTGAAWLVIELFASLVLLGVMFAFDPLLAALIGAAAAANIGLMAMLSRMRADTERQFRHEQATMLGIEAAGLRDMEMIRATAGEGDFFVRWSGQQAREVAARQRFSAAGYVIGALPRLFSMIGAIIVLGVGGWQVAQAELSAGELIAFYTLAGAFLVPIGRFVQFADSFMVLDADLQRVQDVLDAPEDRQAAPVTPEAGQQTRSNPDFSPSPKVATFAGRLRLAGSLELRDVTFGFNQDRSPLICGLSITIQAGQRVAFVGLTGSGKSTLLRLISGELAPDSGVILFDGAPRADIPPEVFANSLSSVDQQIHLFAASVRDNLTMWNAAVQDEQMIEAARDARIHDEIMGRAGGYDSMVAEGGRNFSGGQRQRLEIARALTKNPSILLADEATSTLDAVTEREIDDGLRRRGLTCVIVAHRLATIRDCDEIVVLDRGQAAQQGAHDELLEDRDGLYRQLVEAQ